MKIGDAISGNNGQRYEIKSLLGHGLWAKTFSARSKEGGEWILKTPLQPSDFPAGEEHLAEICRNIVLDLIQLFEKNRLPDILAPKKSFVSDQGIPALIFHHNENHLERKLNKKISLQELL